MSSSRHYLGNTLYCVIFIRCIDGEWVEGDKGARGINKWMNMMKIEDAKQNDTLLNLSRSLTL